MKMNTIYTDVKAFVYIVLLRLYEQANDDLVGYMKDFSKI